jgi:hypothetical protein
MYLSYLSRTPTYIAIMSDAEIEHKREEDERLDTAEDPNEEVRHDPETAHRGTSPETVHTTHLAHKKNAS